MGSVQIVMSDSKIFDKYNFQKIDTVHGTCENCHMPTILVAIVSEFYRCTNCGHDTKQYINGSIRYLQISPEDQQWLKRNHSTE